MYRVNPNNLVVDTANNPFLPKNPASIVSENLTPQGRVENAVVQEENYKTKNVKKMKFFTKYGVLPSVPNLKVSVRASLRKPDENANSAKSNPTTITSNIDLTKNQSTQTLKKSILRKNTGDSIERSKIKKNVRFDLDKNSTYEYKLIENNVPLTSFYKELKSQENLLSPLKKNIEQNNQTSQILTNDAQSRRKRFIAKQLSEKAGFSDLEKAKANTYMEKIKNRTSTLKLSMSTDPIVNVDTFDRMKAMKEFSKDFREKMKGDTPVARRAVAHDSTRKVKN